jgi:hypothetical protein
VRGDQTVATESAQRLQPDALQNEPRSPPLPDPDPEAAASRRCRKEVATDVLLRWRLPAGRFPPFFFRQIQLWLERARLADLLVDLQQLLRQFTKAVIGLDLALCLLQRGRAGKGFGNCLSLYFTGQAEVRTMSGLMGLMAATRGLATAAAGSGDRSAAKVGQPEHFLEEGVALLFQLDEGIWHGFDPP